MSAAEKEARFSKVLERAKRDPDLAAQLLMSEVADQWSRIRQPTSRKRRIAEVYLEHVYGSLVYHGAKP